MFARHRKKSCAWALFFLFILPGTASAGPSVFNAPEQNALTDRNYQERYAPLWRRVLEEETNTPSFTKNGGHLRPPDAAQWLNLVQRAEKLARDADKLRMVNGYFNQWRSKSDTYAWSSPEHWDTPREFISQRGGDCEDYAIAKYFALRFLGFPAERMRIVLVRPLTAQKKALPQLHAVLAVASENTWFILDNNARPRDNIFLHTQYGGRFIPLFSMNEKGAWVHLPDPEEQNQKQSRAEAQPASGEDRAQPKTGRP
ncbi:MAG: transglutaminase-like cysteine peptidase [Deltaproteobacteria bacterium]|jgi:predicted transglutaminase-like cysteine proteinase|nr:transglutaminase-like cysteine peptidase [Deltaproteobacteria bacterium]